MGEQLQRRLEVLRKELDTTGDMAKFVNNH